MRRDLIIMAGCALWLLIGAAFVLAALRAPLEREPCRCAGCDPVVPMSRPLTSDEREKLAAIAQGESK